MRTSTDRSTRIAQRINRLARDKQRLEAAAVKSDEKIKAILQLQSDRVSRSIGALQIMSDERSE